MVVFWYGAQNPRIDQIGRCQQEEQTHETDIELELASGLLAWWLFLSSVSDRIVFYFPN